jgi:hypothetical protein
VAAHGSEVAELGGERLADAQAAVEQERDQRVVAGRGALGGAEQGAGLVAVEPEPRAVVGDPRPAHPGGGVAQHGPLVDGLGVEAGERGEVADPRRGGAAGLLELAHPALDVDALGGEHVEVALRAPPRPGAQRAPVHRPRARRVGDQEGGGDPLNAALRRRQRAAVGDAGEDDVGEPLGSA